MVYKFSSIVLGARLALLHYDTQCTATIIIHHITTVDLALTPWLLHSLNSYFDVTGQYIVVTCAILAVLFLLLVCSGWLSIGHVEKK